MAKRNKKLVIVDLFCGAGGFSTAAIRAVSKLGGEIGKFIAVNHWDYAIATHSENHPWVNHFCESVDAVDPKAVIPGKRKRVHLLLASPECTHHSVAAGARPINDQSRVTAWAVLKWMQEIYVDAVVIENVREFKDWGPIGANGRPLQSKKGKTFMSYIHAMREMGYKVDWRVLNCADYGDPTSRERLFIMARRDGKPIVWPEPTHVSPKAAPRQQMSLIPDNRKPHRTAREVIDWSIKGKSIYNREKPLSPNTMKRIMAGLYKYGLRPFTVAGSGPSGTARPKSVDEPLNTILADSRLGLAEPFIVKLYGTNDAASVDMPMPTVTADSNHLFLAEAFVINAGGPEIAPRPVDEPMNTILTREHLGLVQPFVLGQRSNSAPRTVDEPLPTIATAGAIALLEPYILPVSHGNDDRSYPVDEPLRTVTGVHNMGVAQPYVFPIDNAGSFGDQIRSVDEPLGTVMTKNRFALAQPEPFLVVYHGSNREGGERVSSVDKPFPTVAAGGNQYALCEPWITVYNGTAIGAKVGEPMPTVTGSERLALCVPMLRHDGEMGYLFLDILFRMFEPHELAAAMSFPRNYRFVAPGAKDVSKRHKVKMIGNAVPGMTAESLCAAQLKHMVM